MPMPLALIGTLLAHVAAAQTVWSMGAPWTDLAAVIASAAPGDTVLLNGMTFGTFALDKGLTIVGPGVILPMTFQSVQTTLAIPASERARIVDVDFVPFALFSVPDRVVADGTVTFERCDFGDGVPDSLTANGTIMLQRCTFTSADRK